MVSNIRNHCRIWFSPIAVSFRKVMPHIWFSPIAVSFRKVMPHTHSPMRHFISSKDFLYWALLVLCHPSDWWLGRSRTTSTLYSSIDGCRVKLRWHLTGQPHSSSARARRATDTENGYTVIIQVITELLSARGKQEGD